MSSESNFIFLTEYCRNCTERNCECCSYKTYEEEIEEIEDFSLTTHWYDIQYTNLHQYHPHISSETNKLLKAHGRGSFFVVCGYKLSLIKRKINDIETCVARLTPGIHVQDWTIIDFVNPLKQYKKPIYIKVFDENDKVLPNQIFKIGSRYYHGTIGDGRNSIPTYSIIQAIKESDDRTNFRTFYSLKLTDKFGSNGELIDLNNIVIEDFRFPPNSIDPTDPIDPWYPSADYLLSDEEELDDYCNLLEKEDDYDYTSLISRSNSIKWAMIL